MKEDFGILVDIDSIMDTRLGTLLNIDPKKAAVIVKDGYVSSNNDHYGDLDEEFQERYRARGRQELISSTVTGVPVMIAGLLTDVYNHNKKHAMQKVPVVYLNIEPYDLSDEEIEHMVKVLKTEMIYPDVDVVAVRSDMSTVDPAETEKHKIRVVILQQPEEWIASLMDQDILPNSIFKDMTLIGPRTLRHIDPETVGAIDIEHKEGPFRTLEFMMGGMVDLNLVNPVIFRSSVLDEKYVVAARDVSDGKKPDLSDLIT